MSALDKGNRAAAVLGELFAELTRRKRLKELLEQASSEGLDESLVRIIADGIEDLVAAVVPPPAALEPLQPKAVEPPPIPAVEPKKTQAEPLAVPPASAEPPMPPVPKPTPRTELPPVFAERPGTSAPRPAEALEERAVSSRHFAPVKQSVDIPEDGSFYCHGVALIPSDDHPSPRPFALEEKGIDGQRLAFAWDSGLLRFYLSVMREDNAALGRGGVLLLPKLDAIRLRGVHEAIINDLRLHGNILPFSFGSVIKGWESAQQKLSGLAARAHRDLLKLGKTQLWTLNVSAQDNRFMDLQQNPTPEKRRELDRHRTSYSSTIGSIRIDVRELERILNKQRRIAEGIHRDLSTVADRTEVLTIVSLQSGSSEGWKQILHATYDVLPTMTTRFHRMVTDIQYEHLLLELMISLSGDVDSISLVEEPRR